MNGVLRVALKSGELEAVVPPARIRIPLAWLAEYLGTEPDLGMKVAIGVVEPVVYVLSVGEGFGPRSEDGKKRMPLSYIAYLVTP